MLGEFFGDRGFAGCGGSIDGDGSMGFYFVCHAGMELSWVRCCWNVGYEV